MLSLFQQATIPEQFLTADEAVLIARIKEIKERLGDDLFIPGHHYQRDDVIQFADATGDSLQLALYSKEKTAKYIVFCGVHFMAETADLLAKPHQCVVLPDMRAGCSMADMATKSQTEQSWEILTQRFGEGILPITYVNSSADIKAFVGKHGGATVTSSNAKKVMAWAIKQNRRILFLPDQHLGRNTAVELGIPLEHMAVWDPVKEILESTESDDMIQLILWKGHCSVHQHFTVKQIENLKNTEPDVSVIVHPECSYDVVQAADFNGSTKYIIETIEQSEPGSKFAIGTEMNLVNRLKDQHPDKDIRSLNPQMCACITMNRIDLPHLAWTLESIMSGTPINVIKVADSNRKDAKKAISTMFTI
ncbi:quinolinate synthetase [Streptohalobacillus salinus]|uniref:Quinolinate synthase n=1 Tax=Streptohalobacillus salinus TaxID=621096 RepID=A0A2V3WAH4_9BACI|nr:quinolinate synthase NadA [Streptohalobacillus salinus]PXW91407.1 quinolinate synthetase [Streptohalobacillus salinus]